MRMRLEDARIADIKDVAPGTLVRPVSGFGGIFEMAMVVEATADGAPIRGVLALDGQYLLNIFLITDASFGVRVVPHTSLVVDGIDKRDKDAYDSAYGAITLRENASPVLRCRFHNAGNCYVDLMSGMPVKLGEELRESFLGWKLIALDANTKSEQLVASGPTAHQ